MTSAGARKLERGREVQGQSGREAEGTKSEAMKEKGKRGEKE